MKSILSLFSLVLTVFASTAIAAGGGEHGGGHGGLTEKMNALFPPKQPKLEKRAVPAVPELSAPDYYSAVKGNKVTLNWNKIETATEPRFQQLFVEAMAFPHKTALAPNLAKVIDLPARVASSADGQGRGQSRSGRRRRP